jgi:endogenous inhibitor of DNA gyrase (YacG/DUF329 family)
MRDNDTGAASGEFKCAICGKAAKSALVRVGAFCSELCKRALMEKDEAKKAALLAENVDEMPEEFDLEAFERYALKSALHFLKSLPAITRAKWMKKFPLMLVPDEFADQIKGKVLMNLPNDYVSVMHEEKGGKVLMDGNYQFKKKVPKAVMIDALVKAKVFKRPPEAGDA